MFDTFPFAFLDAQCYCSNNSTPQGSKIYLSSSILT